MSLRRVTLRIAYSLIAPSPSPSMRRPVRVKTVFACEPTRLCRHPSIRTRCEHSSLGASWAFSFQQVLQPENRPLFHNSEEGPGVGRSHLNSAVRQSGIVLSRYGIDRRWVVAQGFVDLAVDPQLVKQHR
jgi:hypothetical protein